MAQYFQEYAWPNVVYARPNVLYQAIQNKNQSNKQETKLYKVEFLLKKKAKKMNQNMTEGHHAHQTRDNFNLS